MGKKKPTGLPRGVANSNRILAESLNKRYGKLIVVSDAGFKTFGENKDRLTAHRWRMVNCQCDCGKVIETRLNTLRSGNSKSCWMCDKHFMTNSREFKSWSSMKERCDPLNKRTRKNYFDRGISVCDRWVSSFQNFYEDMGQIPNGKYSLDRINNDLGYFPENCRWATIVQQQNNTRSNRFVFVLGERLTVTEACRKHCVVAARTAIGRLNRGWSDERAILEKA